MHDAVAAAAPPTDAPPDHPSAFALLRATRGWLILLYLFTLMASIALAMPSKPSITADWWASRAAGRPVACGGAAEPARCADARAAAVLAAALSDAAGYAVLGALAAPALGAASDARGRLPLFVGGLAINAAPPAALWAAATRRASLFLYYTVSAVANAAPLSAAALAMAADWLPAPRRAPAFALVAAALYGGMLVGSAAGAVLRPATACALAAAGVAATAAAAAATVPESLPAAAAAAARRDAATASRASGRSAASASLTAGVRIILRSRLYRSLAVIVVATGAAGAGLSELLSQYLAAKPTLHFSTHDQGAALAVFAVGGLLCQLVVVPALVARAGETRTLAAGAAAACILQAGLALANTKGAALAALGVGAGAGLVTPAAGALKANHAPRHEQGAVQGALAAAAGVAAGAGPLLYGAVYYAFGRKRAGGPYFPAAPFWLGTLLCAAAFGLALTVHPDADRGIQGCDSFGPPEEDDLDEEARGLVETY